MKRFIFSIILCLLFASGFAQKNKEALQKIEAARIALITERLNLKPNQAEKFWPVYREYSEERRMIRKEMRGLKMEASRDHITDSEGKKLMNQAHGLKQKELNLDKKYADRILNVISTQQLMSLRKAEDDFRRILLQQLEKRQGQQMRKDQMRMRKERMEGQNAN